MTRLFVLMLSFSCIAALPTEAADAKPAKKLSVEQIIDRNIAARGGLKAWRALNSMAMAGMLYTGKKENAQLPIIIKLKRPDKSRLEMKVQGQTLVQAFDGKEGWKIRRFHGQDIVVPYSPDDAASARAWEDFAAPLIDHAGRNIHAELDGAEAIEGKPAYRLKLLRPDHSEQHVWVDAKSFLDVKSDDSLRRANGEMFKIATFYRDYRYFEGVNVPTTLEVVADGAEGSRKMVFRNIAINPPLDDALFARPPEPHSSTSR